MKSLSLPCDHDNFFYRLVLLEMFGCSVLCESWWEEFSACLSLLGCLLECSSLDVSLSGFEPRFLSWVPRCFLVTSVLSFESYCLWWMYLSWSDLETCCLNDLSSRGSCRFFWECLLTSSGSEEDSECLDLRRWLLLSLRVWRGAWGVLCLCLSWGMSLSELDESELFDRWLLFFDFLVLCLCLSWGVSLSELDESELTDRCRLFFDFLVLCLCWSWGVSLSELDESELADRCRLFFDFLVLCLCLSWGVSLSELDESELADRWRLFFDFFFFSWGKCKQMRVFQKVILK